MCGQKTRAFLYNTQQNQRLLEPITIPALPIAAKIQTHGRDVSSRF
jgi:hypothetical protein